MIASCLYHLTQMSDYLYVQKHTKPNFKPRSDHSTILNVISQQIKRNQRIPTEVNTKLISG